MISKTAIDGTLRSRSLREEIVEYLQQDIITGVFQPGQRIVERELIERFGVSSIPVREALQDLESRGLLTRRLNYGYTVVKLSYMEALRICELRRLLEPKVVGWAAARISPEGMREVEAQLDELEKAATSGDIAAFFHADLKLHQAVWKASDNAFAAKALETMVGTLFASGLARSERETKTGASPPIDRMAEVEKHRRMTEAIKRGDAEGAEQVLIEIASGFERQFQERDSL